MPGESETRLRPHRRGAVRSSLPLFPSRSARRHASLDSRRGADRAGELPAPVPDPVAAELDFDNSDDTNRNVGAAIASYSGLVRRFGAAVTDGAILMAMDVGVVALTLRAAALPLAELATLPLVPLGAFLLVLDVGYLAAFLVLAGRTLGEMVAGMPVRAAGGER